MTTELFAEFTTRRAALVESTGKAIATESKGTQDKLIPIAAKLAELDAKRTSATERLTVAKRSFDFQGAAKAQGEILTLNIESAKIQSEYVAISQELVPISARYVSAQRDSTAGLIAELEKQWGEIQTAYTVIRTSLQQAYLQDMQAVETQHNSVNQAAQGLQNALAQIDRAQAALDEFTKVTL